MKACMSRSFMLNKSRLGPLWTVAEAERARDADRGLPRAAAESAGESADHLGDDLGDDTLTPLAEGPAMVPDGSQELATDSTLGRRRPLMLLL
jgi:hypothetical protein